MQNVPIAERILSLILAPERAHTTIGDLAEEAETHGAIWFWRAVVQTAFAQVWGDLLRPQRAFMVSMLWAAFTNLGIVAALLLAMLLVEKLSPSAKEYLELDCGKASCTMAQQAFNEGAIMFYFLSGWILAWFGKNKELHAALIVVVGHVAYVAYFPIFEMLGFRGMWWFGQGATRYIGGQMLVLAGALSVRYWRLSKIDGTPTVA